MPVTQAAVLTAPRAPVAIQPVSIPEPGPGQVLVEMEACGLCHSDLFITGLERLPYAPLILGHEGIGRIAALGSDVSGWAAGDRVGLTFLATTCGTCEWCLAGRERFCPNQANFGYTIDGALAGYAVAPAAHLVRIPESLPAHAAAPLCCAGWTAYGAIRESGVQSGGSLAVFGLGGLGHLAVQFAHRQGIHVAGVDVSPEKLALARECGAEIALPAENAGRTLQKQHGGVGAAIVFTASPLAVKEAFRSLQRNGILVLVGLSTSQFELPINDTVVRGIQIRGSYLGTRRDLEEVFHLAEAGVARTHVETYDLLEIPTLLDRMHRGELLGRAVVSFRQS